MSESDTTKWRSRALWALAAIVALFLHAGGAALAIANLETADFDEGLGADGGAIGLEMVALKAEETDLPPGPESDASVASPALAQQKAVVKEVDLPKEKPIETEQEADKVVTENNAKKPQEDEPEPAKVETSQSVESVASEATAPQKPSDDATIGDKAQIIEKGLLDDKKRLVAGWAKQISAWFERHKRYPKVDKVKDAKVVVTFELDRTGNVLSAEVQETSGDKRFDDEAIAMLHRASPLPRPPAAQADEGLKFSVPVIFNQKKK